MYVYNPKFVPEYTPFTVDGKTKDAWTVHDYGNGRTYRVDYPGHVFMRVTDMNSGEELDKDSELHKDVCESVLAKCRVDEDELEPHQYPFLWDV
jgi:hypothetical protein